MVLRLLHLLHMGRRCVAIRLMPMVILAGCGEAVYDSIKLMPPPAVYVAGEVDPFPNVDEQNFTQQTLLFYATDRRPAEPDETPAHYANDRGFHLRGGVVTVRADPPFGGWEEVRAISLSTQKSPRRLLRIDKVQEYGVLPVTDSRIVPSIVDQDVADRAGRQFTDAINSKLAGSPQKDIFIYVHGYNVDFDYPVLSSKELQHYMGYRGAFLTYAWPATPNRLAYFKDLETVDATRKNLRNFILFLSRNTTAQNIHIIGYSAGSRLAFETVYDLTLMFPPGSAQAPRLGQLILIGSDLDRSYFIQAMDDGVLESTDSISIYMSSTDSALRVSSVVLGRGRLGQVFVNDGSPVAEDVISRLRETEKLSLIDVSEAPGSSFGNGHSYFRSSPWASSDMFVSLIYGLDAQTRGLERAEGQAFWRFPADYPDRIVKAVKEREQ